MSHKLSATLVLAMALGGCGGKDFDLVVDPQYAQVGITVSECTREHAGASPVCTVRNGMSVPLPEDNLEYTCFDTQGNILYAPGGGRFPDRDLNPGTSVRHKFYCRDSEDLGRIELK